MSSRPTVSPAVDVPPPPDILGLTLAEYAASRRTSVRAARDEYRHALRTGEGLGLPRITRRQREDEAVKFCLEARGVPGGPRLETESVVIPMINHAGRSWNTLCISSQVGCRMGCTFCETARMGLARNLSAAEIVSQFLVASDLLAEPGVPRPEPYRYFDSGMRNIVFMGMGEPLDNLDEVAQAIRVLSEPNGIAFPMSQITVSTVGRIDGLRRLGELGWPRLRLAISLTAANDELRSRLVPINKAMPLADLHRALREYPLPRRGLFVFEYVLLKGVNDSREHARQVAAWCRGLRGVVNLIPYNPQRHAAYETPSDETVLEFMAELRRNDVFVKIRLTRGRDMMGACGQLGNPALA